MLVCTWPEGVNKKFYNSIPKPKENTETTTFLSGRQVSRQINTKKLMTYKLKIEFKKTELETFWTWYNDELGQNANAFTCDALGQNYYRFVSVPEPETTSQAKTVLSMEIEEVF